MRFKDDDDSYSKTIYELICDISTGNKNTQDKIDNGIYPFYVRSNTIERINNYTFDGEAILTAGDGVGVGKVFHYVKGKIGVHQRVYLLSNFRCCAKYLFYHFSSRFYDRVKIMSAKNSVDSVRYDMIAKMKIYLPAKTQIQEKVANFFSLLDQRIDTQSKIIEDLELFKNMISYKVLYDDKTVCYKPLSSFSELKNGYAFKSNTYSSKGDYQIVTIANVTGNRYIDLTSSNKILNIPNDIQSHQILKINDILISLTGNVGRVSYCNKLNCLLNQRVGLLSIKNKDLIEYIFQCIHNKIFEKTMISRGQGVAQLNIGKYDVESFEIPVYSQDRMNTISEVLKLIDFKIIKEKDILELYKKQKAYLLKNMFI